MTLMATHLSHQTHSNGSSLGNVESQVLLSLVRGFVPHAGFFSLLVVEALYVSRISGVSWERLCLARWYKRFRGTTVCSLEMVNLLEHWRGERLLRPCTGNHMAFEGWWSVAGTGGPRGQT